MNGNLNVPVGVWHVGEQVSVFVLGDGRVIYSNVGMEAKAFEAFIPVIQQFFEHGSIGLLYGHHVSFEWCLAPTTDANKLIS